MRTCKRSASGRAVYSEADRDAPHVNDADEAVLVGPPPAEGLVPERRGHARRLFPDRRLVSIGDTGRRPERAGVARARSPRRDLGPPTPPARAGDVDPDEDRPARRRWRDATPVPDRNRSRAPPSRAAGSGNEREDGLDVQVRVFAGGGRRGRLRPRRSRVVRRDLPRSRPPRSRMPRRLQVRITRRAISPRLATSTLSREVCRLSAPSGRLFTAPCGEHATGPCISHGNWPASCSVLPLPCPHESPRSSPLPPSRAFQGSHLLALDASGRNCELARQLDHARSGFPRSPGEPPRGTPCLPKRPPATRWRATSWGTRSGATRRVHGVRAGAVGKFTPETWAREIWLGAPFPVMFRQRSHREGGRWRSTTSQIPRAPNDPDAYLAYRYPLADARRRQRLRSRQARRRAATWAMNAVRTRRRRPRRRDGRRRSHGAPWSTRSATPRCSTSGGCTARRSSPATSSARRRRSRLPAHLRHSDHPRKACFVPAACERARRWLRRNTASPSSSPAPRGPARA